MRARFITVVTEMLRANRECGTEHALARKLHIIADNYSENRNYTVCMNWAAELVAAGWFDQVYNLFGLVGHTHNGVDAKHNQHNTNLLGFPAGYLGDLLANFTRAW